MNQDCSFSDVTASQREVEPRPIQSKIAEPRERLHEMLDPEFVDPPSHREAESVTQIVTSKSQSVPFS